MMQKTSPTRRLSTSAVAPDLPPAQRAIRDRCFHPIGRFLPFERSALEGTIGDRFSAQAARYPQRLAVHTHRHTLTYAALAGAAAGVARALRRELGEHPGPVAIFVAPGAPAIWATLGAFGAGKLCVLVDPTHPRTRTEHILEDSGAALILSDSSCLELARDLGRKVIAVERLEPEDDYTAGRGGAADSPACLLYTSGTTGRPKGVVHSSRSLLHFVMNYTNTIHICPEDRLVALRSMSVIGGMRDVLAALLNGAAVFPLDAKHEGVPAVAAWLREHAITIAFLGSPLFRTFAETLGAHENLPNLRVLRLGSDTVRRADVELYRQRFPQNCILVNGLGGTETGTVCKYYIDKTSEIPYPTVPVGYPLADMTPLVLGDNGEEVAAGELGELAVRSRYLALGYWNLPELTAETFRGDPDGDEERVYLTGNLARRHPDGCVEHLGRRDFQVKVRGYRVELPEIESALVDVAGIREAVVVARRDAAGENRLIAYVVPHTGRAPKLGDLRRALGMVLADHMVPAEFVTVDAIPLNAHGKVDRAALPLPTCNRPDLDAAYAPPGTPIEEKVAAIWAEVLGFDRVGVRDPFLDLGGDSLKATRILARLCDAFDARVPVQVLLASGTVAAMARAVAERLGNGAGTARDRVRARGTPWKRDRR